MADWVRETVLFLLELFNKDPELAKEILWTIKQIEKNPGQLGEFITATRYCFTDPKGRFRISYNFHPDSSQVEIVVLLVF